MWLFVNEIILIKNLIAAQVSPGLCHHNPVWQEAVSGESYLNGAHVKGQPGLGLQNGQRVKQRALEPERLTAGLADVRCARLMCSWQVMVNW
jgi:hypothetical protein